MGVFLYMVSFIYAVVFASYRLPNNKKISSDLYAVLSALTSIAIGFNIDFNSIREFQSKKNKEFIESR